MPTTHQLQLDYPAWRMSFSAYAEANALELPDHGGNFIPDRIEANEARYGEECIHCGEDSWRCEHYKDAEREAMLDAQAEYEDQMRYEREAYRE